MKIVHVNTYDIQGGAARGTYRLHKGLLQVGQDSRMIVKYKHSIDPRITCVPSSNLDENQDVQEICISAIQNNYINTNRSSISNISSATATDSGSTGGKQNTTATQSNRFRAISSATATDSGSTGGKQNTTATQSNRSCGNEN